ncbi:tRNA 5-methoxyuridine(34)/uridine 5-oxyacetic acid(34) synthase CmoB [Catenovulum sp. 2E275]|uniref:tRNA 5-methoxyuridine(34)/uridine 5-oxyacetic acid(34) synthase CmoB n=1 Tax=Catenovulum sp. 2E275 TaxID=2980497 RepID=UPI0021D1ED8D|nr:tRNA 5-methoxyuridine(34)/uridine 5-oxyacetic acid(34) synthase CmoB [Catenovulum sp. 2E275]MCU4674607.1 tRNA 5-methoxyuridine(34)/uridine 5-oxyacetic acid(34) synthase CmoB [Catenovulum sp. 2E275]
MSKTSLFAQFYQSLLDHQMDDWLEQIPALLNQWQKQTRHGDFANWQKTIKNLPKVTPSQIELKQAVTIGLADDLNQGEKIRLEKLLPNLMPWRKGPYHLFDLHLDTEWRSDWKWDRVLPHITPLKDKTVLDVGCGNGYHMWRMLGEDAKLVVGADPTELFVAQFQVFQHFINRPNIHLLPLGVEQLPACNAFDTVFSMGVLYHRKSPIDFIQQLKAQLKPGGELVLETIVIPGDEHQVLVPGERYAKMRNVWFIPSSKALCHWLERCGFSNIRVVDETTTSLDEQRKTQWMQNESLADFLDPNDQTKTIEGYPAPIRAVIIANK